MRLTVARIGRAHGLRGEVALELRTDDPAARLVVGAVLDTDPASAGPLTVGHTRTAQGRWYATFDQVGDRTAAEELRGVLLVVTVEETGSTDEDSDDDSWYRHELVGLRAERVGDHALLGTVVDLEHPPAHDLLVLREPDGTVSRVPFVRQIVPVVDVAGGRVLLDPPGGLLSAEPSAEPGAEPETER
ncbi:MAG: ribosome maturation factor RimM [Micrococcales bacterium]|nr:ribosome maturation factor RimM [Micrococcales bacterium]